MIRVVHPGSGSSDPGVNKAPDLGSGSATLIKLPKADRFLTDPDLAKLFRNFESGKSSQDLEKIFSIRPALKFRIQVHNSADWSFVGHKVGLTWSAEDRSGINFPSDGGDGSDSRPQEIAPCPGNMEFCETALDYPSRHVPQVIHSNFTHNQCCGSEPGQLNYCHVLSIHNGTAA
jgi:hypothetical protein